MSSSPLDQTLEFPLSEEVLASLNSALKDLSPEEILGWAVEHLPGLHQTTAFGLTGLVAMDMLSKLSSSPPPLIFVDTLYHFPETYQLVEEVKNKYSTPLHIYRPENAETVQEFEEKYGSNLWKENEDRYDYLAKVEPARRAYEELGVKSVITGRRTSQGADRANLQPLEVDATGLIKLNPLFAWTFPFVEWYIDFNDVPKNKLLSQGYRSIGDWHSTAKVADGADERSGRWAGREKTECGLHRDYSTMKQNAAVTTAS